MEVFDTNVIGDWMNELKENLEDPNRRVPHRAKAQAQNFILLDGELCWKVVDVLLLRCLSFPDSLELMKQVHKGVCKAHQSRVKMRWLI